MKKSKGFIAYLDEQDVRTIGSDLIVENKAHKISISGSLNITKDKEGLKNTYELKRIIDAAIEALRYGDLPENLLHNTKSVK